MKNIDLNKLNVNTTAGEVFTGLESAWMAYLIFKRFGRSLPLAAYKWRHMLGNNVSNDEFMKLAEAGQKLYNLK